MRLPGFGARLALAGCALVGLVLGSIVILNGFLPGPAGETSRTGVGPSSAPGPDAAATESKAAPDEPIALYSNQWFDESGFRFVVDYTPPISDPASLEETRAALLGRTRRGIELLEKELAGLRPGAPETPRRTEQIQMLISALMMYDGRWEEASARFAAAQAADSGRPPEFRANLEAAMGIAALRRGEVENCVACCNELSCIFPLADEAIHRQTAGSEEAIERFSRYLRQRPDDLGIRWLLNVASMTLGKYPDGVPAEFRLPLGRFAPGKEAAPPGRLPNVATRVGLNVRGEAMAGGCIVDDLDGDGLLDVLTTCVDPGRGTAFFHNRGDGTFEDRSTSAGLDEQTGSLNACHADYDNDGDLDLLLERGGWELPRRLSLMRNRGDGTFEDVSVSAGLGSPIATQAAGWADYDNDGYVDLYVAGEYAGLHPDPLNRGRLYHNNRDGTFTDIASKAGVTNDRFGKGVAWGDYNNDRWPDLYVANLQEGANRLYRNNGDGTFADVASALGVTGPEECFACWFWDYDNDGHLDLWVNPYGATLDQVIRDQLGWPTLGERARLYRNQGGSKGFRDVTSEVGLDRVVLPMGSNFGDIDNDGFLDMYLGTGRPQYSFLMPNICFRNEGGQKFRDVTAATGTGHLQKGHGVAFADWDRDGDQDLFLESGGATPGDKAHNVLFQNPGSGHHWLTVRLVGTKTNRAALGARIRVEASTPGGGVLSLYRTITAGSSFGGNPLACTIGLGQAGTIRSLEVDWPTSGLRQDISSIPVDRSVEITEGEAGFRLLDAPPIALP